MDENLPFGPPPISPSYQGDCTSIPDPNPYFPKPSVTWAVRPPPFWYPGDHCNMSISWPVGNIDDYKFETLPEPISEKTLLEEMEVDRPERYLPGEIYRNDAVKRPIEDLSKTANCPKKWSPKDRNFYNEFCPTFDMMNPPLLIDGVLQRQTQTFNSYLKPGKKTVRFAIDCECIEDTETKNIKKPNYSEALKYADTRPEDFKCQTDSRVCFEDACKIPDTSVKVPPGVLRKTWRPSGADLQKPGTLKIQTETRNDHPCMCSP